MSFANGMRKPKRPRSVQTIMRIVIRLGRYGADDWDHDNRQYRRICFMCIAAGVSRDHHEITPEEHERVRSAIKDYLGPFSSLPDMLRQKGVVPVGVSDDIIASTVGRELYWNWNKRPRPAPALQTESADHA